MDSAPRQTYPDDIDIAMLWRAIARNLPLIVFIALIVGVVTYMLVSRIPPSYLSRAEILIERDDSAYTRPKGETQPQGDAARIDENEMESQARVVTARDQLLRVAKELGLEKSPEFNAALARKGPLSAILSLIGFGSNTQRMSEEERVLSALSEKLSVFPVAKSRVLAIEVVAHDSELAAKTANAIADAYIAFNTAGQLRQDDEASDWLGSELENLKKAAELAETELERYRAQSGLLNSQNNVTIGTQQLSEVNTQLTQAKAQRNDAEARARLVREMLGRGDIDASPEVLKSPLVQRLIEQRIRVDREIAELSATLLPGHPRMRQLAAELRGLQTQIRNEALKVVRSLENEVQVAAARQRALEATLAELTAQIERSSESQARLRVLEREAQSRRAVYETYLDRYNDVKTRRDRPVSTAFARMLSRAAASSVPVSPRKIPTTLLAVLGTLLAGLGIVVSRELVFASRGGYRTMTPAPAQPTPFAPASAPPAPAAPARQPTAARAVSRLGRKPVRLGSVAAVAQHLAHRARSIPGYRTMITSQSAGTTPASEALAIARKLAAGGNKVVLIDWTSDGDGAVGTMGIVLRAGLTDLIQGSARFEDILHTDPASPLHVVGVGHDQLPLAMGEANTAEQLSLVLDALDEIYRHVVLYCSPDLAVSLFEALQGRFDAGILIRDTATQISPEAGGFLGHDVPELEVIWLEPSGASRRPPIDRDNGHTTSPIG